MPDRAAALHVGGLGLAVEPQASAIAALVREAGPETLVLVDPNCRDGVVRARTAYCDRLRDLMCLADVVKASEEDLAYLDPDRTPHQTARALLARGPAMVLLTNGSRGATVLTARCEGFVQAPAADVVDTIGAGDAFGAAWLGAWVADGLGRQDLGDFDAVLRTAEFAALVAARTCERAGARASARRGGGRDGSSGASHDECIRTGEKPMLGTLARAGAVLDLFTTDEPEWGVTATAQRLGIGKSLAHDVLASLAGIGLLQRVGHGRYRLGWRTVTLASVLLRTSELKAHARPVVRDLAERQGLTVSLAAWDCGRIIYIDRRYSARHPSACGPAAGTAVPLDGSAASKVLLASRPSAEIKMLWGDGLVHTRHASVDELELDLERDPAARLGAQRRRGDPGQQRRRGTGSGRGGQRRGGDQPRPARPRSRRRTSTSTRGPSSLRRRESQRRSATTRSRPDAGRVKCPRAPEHPGRCYSLLAENVSVNCLSGLGSSGGVTTMTGRPSASTRVGRSLRSHSDRRLGRVEIRMSS